MEAKTKRDLCFQALKCLYLEAHESIAADVKKKVTDYIAELEQPKCSSCGRSLYSYCSVCNPRR